LFQRWEIQTTIILVRSFTVYAEQQFLAKGSDSGDLGDQGRVLQEGGLLKVKEWMRGMAEGHSTARTSRIL